MANQNKKKTNKKLRARKDAAVNAARTAANKRKRTARHLKAQPNDTQARLVSQGLPADNTPKHVRCFGCNCRMRRPFESRLIKVQGREQTAHYCRPCAKNKAKGKRVENKPFAGAFSAEYRCSLPKYVPERPSA